MVSGIPFVLKWISILSKCKRGRLNKIKLKDLNVEVDIGKTFFQGKPEECCTGNDLGNSIQFTSVSFRCKTKSTEELQQRTAT